MNPSVLSNQLRQGVEDFLRTTFPPSNTFFHGILDRLLSLEGGVFRGPYVSLKLPFREGQSGKSLFPELSLKFTPYLHQENAFRRLSGDHAQSTIISTGTGSGKTESFLYPILDHCRKRQGKLGIKAILIYPMNALATDQAKRLAHIIWNTPSLKDHVTAGLFIGGEDKSQSKVMSEGKLITSRATMRLMPPDILLTNYKMLDYLMVRPNDARLWAHNEPDTLRFLVVDELHTFDGAQGTDLACLIRRLKERLHTPKGTLVCVGTSATLGASEDVGKLRNYAQTIFGEQFDDQAIITELRIGPADFLGSSGPTVLGIPGLDKGGLLSPESFGSHQDYIAAQIKLWFGRDEVIQDDSEWKLRLANDLKQHEVLSHLLSIMRDPLTVQSEVLSELGKVIPAFQQAPQSHKINVLNSFLAMLSCAKRRVENTVVPFLQVRYHLWLRELRRLVAEVKPEPNLVFSDDLNEDQLSRHLPVIHCRECGAIGWGAYKRKQDHGLLPDLQQFYARFFSADPSVHFVFPLEDGVSWEGGQQQFISYICGQCLHLTEENAAVTCPACTTESHLIPVLVFNPRSRKGHGSYGSHDCPYCNGFNSLTILGSRAASISSVLISQLYSSRFNDDKKLLAFSDSVQDASHRAGFFAARTFRFNFRSALQKCVAAQTLPPSLTQATDAFFSYWQRNLDDPQFVASFLPPDLAWFDDYESLKKQGTLPSGSRLLQDLRARLSWEIASEYGFNGRIGRTLEKTGCSIAIVAPETLNRAAGVMLERLKNEVGGLTALDEPTLIRFLRGLICQLKNRGGIDHPALEKYIKGWGNVYVLNNVQFLPKFGNRSRAPSFLTTKRDTRFDALLGLGSNTTWWQHWHAKTLGRLNSDVIQFADPILHIVLKALTEAGILRRHEVEGLPIWGLNPESMIIMLPSEQYRCSQCGHSMSAATQEKDSWNGMPCLRFNCDGSYKAEGGKEDYYGSLYSKGDVERLFPEEHTGLLDRKTRDDIELRFKRSQSERKPADPNLLSCTPTLEMGIDIGDLSTVILCSVPPAQANYLQRVGRTGRKDGNSLAVTLANGRAHDLYFFAKPEEMLAGRVDPPGCFLDAPAVLERQFTAFCIDRWVESGIDPTMLPLKLGAVLSNLGKADRKGVFPYTLLSFIENHCSAFLDRFARMFQPELNPESVEYLKTFSRGGSTSEGSLAYRIIDNLFSLFNEQKSLKKRVQALTKAIREKKDSPLRDLNYDQEMDQLESEKASLNAIISKINDKNTFNFFTDEGLLPNYTFPEAGVTLRSIILRKKAKADEHGKYKSLIYEYERPAATAIGELAPANRFYAEGRMVTIDQIDMMLSSIEDWRFCNECSHHERVLTGGDTQSCPRCHSTIWKDDAQKRQMIRMRQVIATTYDRDSRSHDDSDDREPEFYSRQILVDYDPKFITSAWKLESPEFPFGFEFLRKVSFREINFGQPEANADEINIAGKPMPKNGFSVCRECGKVDRGGARLDHAISCRYRNAAPGTSVQNCLYLYRDFSSEAIRILLPVVSLAEERKLHSFVAALYLGLRKRFGGNIDHLRTAIQEEPLPESSLRKKFLVLYDIVPGGTGYLKELMRPPDPLKSVFALAWETLRACECGRFPDKDGCYRCLYIYNQSQERAHVSRKAAMDLLARLLDSSVTFTKTDTISNIPVNSLLESELEARFIEALGRSKYGAQAVRLKPDIVNGKPGWQTQVAGQTWLIEPQVELGENEGIPIRVRPDFVFHPIRSGSTLPIAVFTDGFTYHAQGGNHRVGKDLAQRTALLRSGRYLTWSLTWEDVEDQFKNPPGSAFDNLLETKNVGALLNARGLNIMLGHHEKNNFALLLEYLANPDPSIWAAHAAIHALGLPHSALVTSEAAARMRAEIHEQGTERPEHTGGDCFVGVFERLHDQGGRLVQFCCFAPKDSAQTGAIADIELVGRLFDEEPLDTNPTFKGAWGGFLRAFNVFQFLPRLVFFTTRGLELGEHEAHLEQDARSTDRSPTTHSPKLSELLDLTVPEVHPLLRNLDKEALQSLEPGYELLAPTGGIIATAELAWPSSKTALLLDSEVGGQTAFEKAGWTVFRFAAVRNDMREFLDSLRTKGRQGDANGT